MPTSNWLQTEMNKDTLKANSSLIEVKQSARFRTKPMSIMNSFWPITLYRSLYSILTLTRQAHKTSRKSYLLMQKPSRILISLVGLIFQTELSQCFQNQFTIATRLLKLWPVLQMQHLIHSSCNLFISEAQRMETWICVPLLVHNTHLRIHRATIYLSQASTWHWLQQQETPSFQICTWISQSRQMAWFNWNGIMQTKIQKA